MAKKKVNVARLEKILTLSWHAYIRAVSNLKSESAVEKLLELELNVKNRASIVERIHSRMNTLRFRREKRELASRMTANANE